MLQSIESLEDLKGWLENIKAGKQEVDETKLWRHLSQWEGFIWRAESTRPTTLR